MRIYTMIKTLLVAGLLLAPPLLAQDEVYVTAAGTQIVLGNRNIERTIDVSPKGESGGRIVNKIPGSVFNVKSLEFGLKLVFSGTGPAYSTEQNGENGVVLTSRDFQFRGYTIEDLSRKGKELKLTYTFNHDVTALTANVYYDVYPNTFYIRKWVELSDSAAGIQFMDRVFLESLTFEEKDFSHGQFGQPVFNKDIFLGVEYPTAENTIESGKVTIGYVVGETLTKAVYKSHSSIVGAASSAAALEQAFMKYVDDIRADPPRPFLLYNTWYDLRRPSLAENAGSVMNEENVLHRIQDLKKNLDQYSLNLDAFVLDEGWDNFQSVWAVDSTRFPHGLTRVAAILNGMKTSLGMWASPWGGYESRERRSTWAAANGYETTGDFLCFAGTKYKTAMKEAMVDYTREYNVGYFKWDGFLLGCSQPHHGHLPGIYSREAFVSTYIDMMNAVRREHPHIFLNITVGTWLSPWWLKYADCIWMQGADYAYVENVPCLSERDKAITYRDGVLWDDFGKQQLLFPMSSLMTHGIIKGQLNLLGGKDESTGSFCNEVMMYFGRGIMMWELYVSPKVLSPSDWNAIASSARWAKANVDVLAKTKMILGNPVKREPYGYLHMTKRKGILVLRNPDVVGQHLAIKLSPELGEFDSSTKYFVKVVYPYTMILPKPVGPGESVDLHLDSYEVLTAELIPSDSLNKNLPVNRRFSIREDHLTVYGRPGEKANIIGVGSPNLGEVTFDGVEGRVGFKEYGPPVVSGKSIASRVGITIPLGSHNARFGFLLEPKSPPQNSKRPQFSITVNGVPRELTVEEANGKWFWVLADLQVGENDVRFSVEFENVIRGTLGLWIFADQDLAGKDLGRISAAGQELLPAAPYPETIQKLTIPITTYTL